ncbi:hypothetical protein L6164_007955 [Bauhinia variegata]|uniref:Uncharacterized protein n=1 Tax=Bauhinia variegata TaxID=167791 RepID=A0ACB9PGM4_BAUVA|nr:hypothetical protein L6164_007955 [Bauhinia variegata]
MASFTLNSCSLKQESLCLISLTFSRYHSMLNTCKFHSFPHFHTHLPLKTSLELKVSPDFAVKKAHASVPKLGALEHETSTRAINSSDSTETETGCSSVKSILERVTKKRAEKGFSRNIRKTPGYRERRGINSRHSSQSSKDDSTAVGEKMEKKGNENLVGKGNNKGKKSKKDKDSPADKLRLALDQCSKRGDVMGALSLYDSAQREGVKLGQHHSTVLLYLCSSAAFGVVQPAKSGSGNRTLNALASYNEAENPMELSESANKNDRDFLNTMPDGPALANGRLTNMINSHDTVDDIELNSSVSNDKNITKFSRNVDGKTYLRNESVEFSPAKDVSCNQEDRRILVSEDVKKYALQRGFEIYENMCLDKVPMNEAALTAVARMAMSMGDGDMAFEMVRQMKALGINPRLRSYGPALSAFSNSGDVDKAFAVEKHMLEHGVFPEEPELEALLRVSVGAGQGDKVYYLLHKLRTNIRKVSPPTADVITDWFNSKQASKVGKRKWDKKLIKEAIENNGGGWHGQGWLGKGKWKVSHTNIGTDGICKCCGLRLATIDLDPIETEDFAKSVASIAITREKHSNFQKFQKWLANYGPFEAVIDAANVGLYGQGRFIPSRINAVVNGIRQKLPSKKFPLIILHNKRITGHKMDAPLNRALVDKWRNANALYATPTGSNDDWYWLYAAIKFKCLLVTNDEMRDHIFQLLGNDFFPRWKERHQVHFSFPGVGPEFHMPTSYSVVIQESEDGHWHIPVESEHNLESERRWLCITLAKTGPVRQETSTSKVNSKLLEDEECARSVKTIEHLNHGNHEEMRDTPQEKHKNLRNIFSASVFSDHRTLLSEIEAAELLAGCTIDFQI